MSENAKARSCAYRRELRQHAGGGDAQPVRRQLVAVAELRAGQEVGEITDERVTGDLTRPANRAVAPEIRTRGEQAAGEIGESRRDVAAMLRRVQRNDDVRLARGETREAW